MSVFEGRPDVVVGRLYRALLHRDPDPAGLRAYLRLLRQGVSLAQISRELVTSREFRLKTSGHDSGVADPGRFESKFSSVSNRADFALLNKSYAKDMEWSVFLYASANIFVRPMREYYLVVPKSEIELFATRFAQAVDDGVTDKMPVFFAEEDFLARLNIVIPDKFNGWMTQQVVKLGFGLTGLAENYLVIDSATVFVRPFDWRQKLFDDAGNLKTAARPLLRANRRADALRAGRMGWNNGKLVSIHEAFDYISEFFGNATEQTYHHVSGTAIFSSAAIRALFDYIRKQNVADFAQLIAAAPYECAWYGEFIHQKKPIKFVPTEPDLAWICASESALESFEAGSLKFDQSAVCIQSPNDRRISPLRAFNLALRKYALRDAAG